MLLNDKILLLESHIMLFKIKYLHNQAIVSIDAEKHIAHEPVEANLSRNNTGPDQTMNHGKIMINIAMKGVLTVGGALNLLFCACIPIKIRCL